jgi:hypothetical protein
MTTPKGITDQEYEIGRDIVIRGFKNGEDQSIIRANLVKADINIDRHLTVFTAIAIEEGLIVDPVKIREKIRAILDDPAHDYKSYTDYERDIKPLIDYILSEVANSDYQTTVSVLKAKFKNEGLECPKIPRAKTWSAVEKGIIDLFADDCDTTKQEYDEFIDKQALKSPDKWKKMYPMYSCIAKGEYSDKGLK